MKSCQSNKCIYLDIVLALLYVVALQDLPLPQRVVALPLKEVDFLEELLLMVFKLAQRHPPKLCGVYAVPLWASFVILILLLFYLCRAANERKIKRLWEEVSQFQLG
jgi:hypothetical protein